MGGCDEDCGGCACRTALLFQLFELKLDLPGPANVGNSLSLVSTNGILAQRICRRQKHTSCQSAFGDHLPSFVHSPAAVEDVPAPEHQMHSLMLGHQMPSLLLHFHFPGLSFAYFVVSNSAANWAVRRTNPCSCYAAIAFGCLCHRHRRQSLHRCLGSSSLPVERDAAAAVSCYGRACGVGLP